MKRLLFLIAFCLSLSAIYAQTVDVIHLKSGFDARGTITNRTESQITLQTENGRTLTIDMNEIDSMEQEEVRFDPRVLIGRWACYKANGDRDKKYDIIISENEGFYTVSYVHYIKYFCNDDGLKSYPDFTPDAYIDRNQDIDVEEGKVCFHFWQLQKAILNYSKSERKRSVNITKEHCDINLKYIDGKLKGSVDCTQIYVGLSCDGYNDPDDCGTIFANGPGEKWNAYYVKY